MNLTIPLIAIKAASRLGHLGYRRVDLGNTQKRLVGRYALEPEISLEDFTCRAVIDWIRIRFCLCRETQRQWLQHELEKVLGRKPYVSALNPKPGGLSDTFDVTLQEPQAPELRDIPRAINEKYKLMLPELVEEIEFSVDFTPKQPDDVLRAKFYTALTRHFFTDADILSEDRDRPRFAWGQETPFREFVIAARPGDSRANEHFLRSAEGDHSPHVDATYYVGAKEAHRRWRVMDKVVDRQNKSAGTSLQLDEFSKRVRIEVTLDRAELRELGVTHIEDFRELSFSGLQGRYFRFVLPTFRKAASKAPSARLAFQLRRDQERWLKFRNAGAIGLRAMDDALERQVKTLRRAIQKDVQARGLKLKPLERVGGGKFGSFVSYDTLNRRVETALRHLGERVAASLR